MELFGDLKSGVETRDSVPLSSLARGHIVANMPAFVGEERGVDIVTNSYDSDDVILIIEKPAMGTGDDSDRKVNAFLIIFERLSIGFEVITTFGIPFTIYRIMCFVVVQHPLEGVAVGLVKGYDDHE